MPTASAPAAAASSASSGRITPQILVRVLDTLPSYAPRRRPPTIALATGGETGSIARIRRSSAGARNRLRSRMSQGQQNFLAFDLGAESGRAIVGTLSGGRLTLEEKHRFANPNGRIHGHMQWNLLAQWEALKTGLRKCAGVELAGIGVDTWGVD